RRSRAAGGGIYGAKRHRDAYAGCRKRSFARPSRNREQSTISDVFFVRSSDDASGVTPPSTRDCQNHPSPKSKTWPVRRGRSGLRPRSSQHQGASAMKRYIIERDLPGVGGLNREQLKGAAETSNGALAKLPGKVQWVHSYVA